MGKEPIMFVSLSPLLRSSRRRIPCSAIYCLRVAKKDHMIADVHIILYYIGNMYIVHLVEFAYKVFMFVWAYTLFYYF